MHQRQLRVVVIIYLLFTNLFNEGHTWVSQVPIASLGPCHVLGTPVPSLPLAIFTGDHVGFRSVKNVADTSIQFFEAESPKEGAASLRPSPCSVYASHLLFCLFTNKQDVRQTRNTRYRWLARPYRTGTCTLQEATSFACRTNTIILQFLLIPVYFR